MVETASKRSSLEDSRRNLLEDSIESHLSSTTRPLEHPSRPSSRTNGSNRRSASAARASNQLMAFSSQPQSPNFESERLKTPDDDAVKYTVKQMNLQLIGL